MSSSSLPSPTEQQRATTPTNESSIQQLIERSVISSPTVPVLPGQILTQRDHEDNLLDGIDQVIGNFLNRFNGQHPYQTVFRWTLNNASNLTYSIVLAINGPENI